ncbi:MAG: hypothetical protein ACK42I_01470 [Thermomicrobium sp.]
MRRRRLSVLVALVLFAALVTPPLSIVAAQQPGLSVAFWRTWARTDRPVAEGRAARTWMWGPVPITNVRAILEVLAPGELANPSDGSLLQRQFAMAS